MVDLGARVGECDDLHRPVYFSGVHRAKEAVRLPALVGLGAIEEPYLRDGNVINGETGAVVGLVGHAEEAELNLLTGVGT